MNKLSALALGAALALSAPIAINAQSLDLGVDVDGGVGVEAGDSSVGVDANTGAGVNADTDGGLGVDAGVNAGLGASVDANSDFDVNGLTHADVEAAIQSSAMINLNDIDATADIEIVAISALGANDGGDASVLADTRAAFDADISALQSEISANTALVAALDAEGYAADDVVAVWTHGSGAIVLFVDA